MKNAMKYKRVFVLGGTTEGKELSKWLIEKGIAVWLSVATAYGKEQMQEVKGVHLIEERLDEEAMIKLLAKECFECVIDATHPYAQLVTQNIRVACEKTKTLYKRVIRTGYEKEENIWYFKTVQEIIAFLEDTKGHILLTTGSKDLEAFTALSNYQERLYARMLPMPKIIESALARGYLMSHLICMQGPFSSEMNEALLTHIEAAYLVTKDSGDVGGMEEKVKAALKLGVKVICLERPLQEQGLSLEQLYKWLEEV